MSGNINTRRHICHIRKKFLRDGCARDRLTFKRALLRVQRGP